MRNKQKLKMVNNRNIYDVLSNAIGEKNSEKVMGNSHTRRREECESHSRAQYLIIDEQKSKRSHVMQKLEKDQEGGGQGHSIEANTRE